MKREVTKTQGSGSHDDGEDISDGKRYLLDDLDAEVVAEGLEYGAARSSQ